MAEEQIQTSEFLEFLKEYAYHYYVVSALVINGESSRFTSLFLSTNSVYDLVVSINGAEFTFPYGASTVFFDKENQTMRIVDSFEDVTANSVSFNFSSKQRVV